MEARVEPEAAVALVEAEARAEAAREAVRVVEERVVAAMAGAEREEEVKEAVPEEALESLQACAVRAGTEVESRMQSQCSFPHKTHLRPFRVQSDCDTNACCHQAT